MENVWEQIHASRDWGRWPSEELVKFVGRNFFRIPKVERHAVKVAELGIGQGANIWFMIKEGLDTYGIDISPSALEKLKTRLEEEGFVFPDFDSRFKAGDIREIPFDDALFDVVIDYATVWCVSYSDHRKVYREIKRILKPGGLFFQWHILKPSWGYDDTNLIDRDTVANVSEGPLKDQGTTYFAEYGDIVELLENEGFEIVDQEYLIRTYEKMEKFLKSSILVAKKVLETRTYTDDTD